MSRNPQAWVVHPAEDKFVNFDIAYWVMPGPTCISLRYKKQDEPLLFGKFSNVDVLALFVLERERGDHISNLNFGKSYGLGFVFDIFLCLPFASMPFFLRRKKVNDNLLHLLNVFLGVIWCSPFYAWSFQRFGSLRDRSCIS